MLQELEYLRRRNACSLDPHLDSLALVVWLEASRNRLRGKVGRPIHDPFWVTPVNHFRYGS